MKKETGIKQVKPNHSSPEMEDQEHQLMVFFNAMDDVLFSVDMTSNKVIQVSPACEKLYGYSQADFMADYMFWFEVIHPDDLHIVRHEDKILLRGDQVNNQYRIVRKDKTIRWVENKIIPSLDASGKLVRVDGITRDITKSKAAEEELRKSEANLRTIFDNTDSAYILFSDELRIVSFNLLAQKYSQQQSNRTLEVGKLVRGYFTDERWPFVQQVLERVRSGEEVNYQLSFTNPDGSLHWNDVRWLNVKNAENKSFGYILANKDISEAKNAALERERITAHLIQHVKDLEQFTYIISHNLRAPVANIIGLSEMLKEHDLDVEAKMEVLDRVSLSVKNIDTVITDLNQILQSRDMVNERKETVYFNELLGTIKTSIYNIVVNEKVQFDCDFSEIGSLFTIRSYLYSIFYNLTSNSIKYRQKGVAPIITIHSRKLKDKVKLVFKDNGKGIDLAKNAEQLFGLYKRFDTSMEGKGMGLFMVKTQVETLGGTIQIKSKLGEGTEFTILLPL